MAFFLNEEQEVALNEFLTEENKKVCEKQILEDKIPKEFRDLIESTMDSGSPLPFFDPLAGYYTLSFTPCEKGERIYVHHHLSGVSKAIYDPAMIEITTEDVETEEGSTEPTELTTENNIVDVDFDSEGESRDKISGVYGSDDGIYTTK